MSPVIEGVVALGNPPWPTLDPFLFCVHHNDAYPEGNASMGPVASLAGRNLGQDFAGKDGWSMYHGREIPGFPSHPHRGFETITLARRGFIDHSDSLGATARFGEGDVQWMTAGKGIQHSEMFPLVHTDAPNPAELFQIWMNLPAHDKMVDPHFTMFWSETIPRRLFTDAQGRTVELVIIAGSYKGESAPAPPPNSWASKPGSEVAISTFKFSPGARFVLDATVPEVNRALYFFEGDSMRFAGTPLDVGHRIQLRSSMDVELVNGDQPAELLLLQGRPIREPVAHYGPFVMNTRKELEAAFADYRSTQFGGWPWDKPDPVHPREMRRFARHADGREEKPV